MVTLLAYEHQVCDLWRGLEDTFSLHLAAAPLPHFLHCVTWVYDALALSHLSAEQAPVTICASGIRVFAGDCLGICIFAVCSPAPSCRHEPICRVAVAFAAAHSL